MYDYEKNEDNLDILFCVITTKEKSKVIEHRIGDTDSFKIIIVNIADLGMDRIINNARHKIKHNFKFSIRELVELVLTSIMPDTREKIIEQFYNLSEMMDEIQFEDDNAKTSFCAVF